MHVHGVVHSVQHHSRQHPGQAEAMVAVHMGEADAVDLMGGDPGMNHLPLRALPGIEEVSLPVPAQDVTVVVTGAGGHLGGGTQHGEVTHAPESAVTNAGSRAGGAGSTGSG